MAELKGDPRFKDLASRTQNIREVYQILADARRSKTSRE
jgi:crotonobetainyl-CoA:carnitine CoA-transferase CaiB-like acyl-CoA transferase